jgi:PIN domain nuclease of toxin-antitoxin system
LLHPDARKAIADSEGAFVSAASAWEVAIKIALGKLRIPGPFAAAVEASRFGELAITFRHAALAGALPAHHADPFDRMLVAQARVEDMPLLTRDRSIIAYGRDGARIASADRDPASVP